MAPADTDATPDHARKGSPEGPGSIQGIESLWRAPLRVRAMCLHLYCFPGEDPAFGRLGACHVLGRETEILLLVAWSWPPRAV